VNYKKQRYLEKSHVTSRFMLTKAEKGGKQGKNVKNPADFLRTLPSPFIRVIEDLNCIPAEVKRLDKSESFRATYRTLRATQMNHAARRES
jgi:hypothetical protein